MKLSSKIILLSSLCIALNSACNVNAVLDQVGQGSHTNASLLLQESFPIASIKGVDVRTSGGSITLNGDADQQAVLEMYVKSNKGRNLSERELKDILDNEYDLDIELRDGTLYAHAERRGGFSWFNGLSISFKVRTGARIDSELSTSGGSISLSNLEGKQVFKTSGGSLTLDNLSGQIDGRTSGGRIKVNGIQGEANLRTSGGSIHLENIDGKLVGKTSGGSIKAEQVKGDLDVRTSGGSININELSGKVSASSSGGSVNVDILELQDDVKLSTSGGSINLTLPANASMNLALKGSRVIASNLSNFTGDNSRGKLAGTVNGGGINVEARTSGGNVNLTIK